MEKTNKKKLLLFVMALAPVCAFAQDYNNAPVYGGFGFWVVAGLSYGIKKIKDSRTKQKRKK